MKAIKLYEGRYSVTIDGKVYSHLSNMFMSQYSDRDGYKRLGLTGQDGVQKIYAVHRLVAEAFIPNPDNKETVNHIDGDKSNNFYKNLEWATIKENNIHAVVNNLRTNQHMYSVDVATQVIKLTCDGWTKKEIATSLGLDINSVHNILYSPQYQYIREEFDWENRPNKQLRLSVKRVLAIAQDLENGLSYKEVSKKNNVSLSIVSSIKLRKTHSTLTKNFKF